MVAFIVMLAVMVHAVKGLTSAASDTTLGVFFAVVVAFGVVILSKGGSFNKFTSYLIGDILVVTPRQIAFFACFAAAVCAYWITCGNNLMLISMNPVLASSRGSVSPLLN